MASNPVSIFVVEDDASVRKALDRLIRTRGYLVHCLEDIESLKAILPLPERSCILADVLLGSATGLEIPKILKSRGAEVPIVFMTATDDQVVIDAASSAGSFECLRKPFESSQLFSALEQVLGDHGCEPVSISGPKKE